MDAGRLMVRVDRNFHDDVGLRGELVALLNNYTVRSPTLTLTLSLTVGS